MILYLGPISYASLRYGSEGAVLTGLWSAVLTVPNLVIWHRTNFEWLEVVYVIVVIVAGIIMSVPVERERQQRRPGGGNQPTLGPARPHSHSHPDRRSALNA